ncbi:hypothetical protein H0A36_17355 [Endozoicomonas sp. SM1973]|uniref:Uncharacterized protein n=1 Tax=Spartinivicinus marinus TaxID=2994442 RepID=A0A853I318_9GAMM|nr:hypothetical protein [Spartinivicinus marinus]MCX4030140.1 hypothetical protein [Spartinivicinus marinus]NYZ67783.1 hypothetical protein [Spartinivicinus marinus]
MKLDCSHELKPIWLGAEIGHFLIPYQIPKNKKYLAKLLHTLWGGTALVGLLATIFLAWNSSLYLLATLVIFSLGFWQWMVVRNDWPLNFDCFAITPYELASEMKIICLSEGDYKISIKRRTLRHIESAEGFKEALAIVKSGEINKLS